MTNPNPELAALAVNAANALTDEKRHYRIAAEENARLRAELDRLRAERDRYRLAYESARERAAAYGEGILRIVSDRETYQKWLKDSQAEVERLTRLLGERDAELGEAVRVSEALNRRLYDEKLAGSALYAAMTQPTTPEQRQAALDQFQSVVQQVTTTEAGDR